LRKRANGSRERAPDDRLRDEVIQFGEAWIASLALAMEAQALIAAAHRLDNLIHHRRMMLIVKAV
jgi:hypothetical protein